MTLSLDKNEWHKAIAGNNRPDEIAEKVNNQVNNLWVEPLLKYTRENQSVLELGSGTGELSAILAKNKRDVTLLDYSQQSLAFSKEVFNNAGLKAEFINADVLNRLPFADNYFNCVWSSGLLEHFSDAQLNFIMKESFRVSQNTVISLVPNARSIAYGLGKRYQKSKGIWKWGKETPKSSLKIFFKNAGFKNIREYTIDPKHSFVFLRQMKPELLRNPVLFALDAIPAKLLEFFNQGYLLLTVGEKWAKE